MELLTREAFETLAKETGEYCVSLYLPVHRTSREVQQDERRFEDMLKKAQAELEENGMRKPDAEELLSKARDLLDHQDFWVSQKDGLVVFISPNVFAHFKLPVELNEEIHVGKEFHLTPLLPLLHGGGEFYILAVSENGVRLLRGSQETAHDVFVDRLPEAGKDKQKKTMQSHSVSSPGGTYSAFHGQGGFKDSKKDEIQEFLKDIEKRFMPMIADDSAPLVFAGDDPLFGMFKEINSFPNLLSEFVHGSPDRMTEQELHDKAWPLIESLVSDNLSSLIGETTEMMGSEQFTDDISEIIPKAVDGKVARLLVAKGSQLKGNYDEETRAVELGSGEEDLINIASLQTIVHGGDVFSVDPDQMPEGTTIAAVLRK